MADTLTVIHDDIDIELGKFRFDRFAALWAVRLRLGERGFRFIRAIGLLIAPEYSVLPTLDSTRLLARAALREAIA